MNKTEFRKIIIKEDKVKKFLCMILALAVIAIAGIISTTSYAATSNNAYVVVKCTVSLSVVVLPATNYVYINGTNGIAASEIWYSSYVAVQNNGSGCIETWQVAVTTQHWSATATPTNWNDGSHSTTTANAGWTLSTTAGINQCVLSAAFSNAATAGSGDFGTYNILTQSYQQWDSGSHGAADGTFQGATAYAQDYVNASGNNNVAAGNTRRLFFSVQAPTAVSDQNYHRFTVTILAAVGM